jgi:hypothetical protein
MTNKYSEYWSWENRHLRLDITRYGINGKMFYLMQPDELLESIQILNKQIDSYKPSISGISISDQERQTELHNALKNANYNLQQKGVTHAS